MAGLFALLQPAFSNYQTFPAVFRRMWEYQALPEDSVDILFLGSSHSGTTIQPQIIGEITGVEGFDIGTAGADLKTAYFILKQSLKTQHPRWVVLETSSIQFGIDQDALVYTTAELLSPGFKQAYAAEYFPAKGQVLSFFPLLQNHTLWKAGPRSLAASWLTVTQQSDRWSSRGFYGFQRAATQEDFQTFEQEAAEITWAGGPQVVPTPEQEEWLGRILALCYAHDIQPVLLRGANLPSLQNGDFLWLEDYAAHYEVPYIDMNKLYTPDSFSRADLFNVDHFTSNGVLPVNVQLAANLSGLLKLPYDTDTSDEILSLYIGEVLVTQEGDQWNIQLKRMVAKAEVEVKWSLFRNGKPLDTRDFSANAFEYTFTDPGPGNLSVRFALRLKDDPGRYTIRSTYPLP